MLTDGGELITNHNKEYKSLNKPRYFGKITNLATDGKHVLSLRLLKTNIMNQEELKTCLGQLLLDLRGNWAYAYCDRLKIASRLCNNILEDTSNIEEKINIEMEGDYDGRIFRGCLFYGYSSKEGTTKEVKEWLENNLNDPEYCSVLQ